jgi:hypothetical protein
VKRLGFFKSETLIGIVNTVGLALATLFAICMVGWPWIAGRGNWGYVQDVWDRWQSLNVGLLAFISSVVAFNIARYNNDRQRAREFLAARASLPATLSSLTYYFKQSANFFSHAWQTANNASDSNLAVPELPHGFQSVFADCIRHAEPEIGEYLAKILARVQIHDSRIRSFSANISSPDNVSPTKHNLIGYIFRLGELQAMVDKIFDFARNMGKFDNTPLDWSDFENSYSVLDINPENIVVHNYTNLEALTKRFIERGLEFNA